MVPLQSGRPTLELLDLEAEWQEERLKLLEEREGQGPPGSQWVSVTLPDAVPGKLSCLRTRDVRENPQPYGCWMGGWTPPVREVEAGVIPP